MAIILASSSPRRREILSMLGIEYEIFPPAEEKTPLSRIPDRAVIETALDKAMQIAPNFLAQDIVIAADTMVMISGILIGKPQDNAEAARYLRMLSGKMHEVLTGVAIVSGKANKTFCERTKVTMRAVSDEEIERYITTGEPQGRAGAYTAYGLGAAFIEKIEGDYFNVLGLPVASLVSALGEFGINVI